MKRKQFKLKRFCIWLIGVSFGFGSINGHAISYDQDVTPNVIFGSGNDNGAFTVHQNGGVELGLRAKVRYDLASDSPKNVFNSNGDGTYNHNVGAPGSNPDRARWNFEWTVNSDFDGSSGYNLNELTYELGMDFDPTEGASFSSFDPINVSFADHGIGDNTTGNGAGTVATDAANYQTLIAANNVAQNSWNLAFFDDPPAFDPNLDATYEFYLTAFDGDGNVAAHTEIGVIVGAGGAKVPESSSTLLLCSMAVFGLFVLKRQIVKQ